MWQIKCFHLICQTRAKKPIEWKIVIMLQVHNSCKSEKKYNSIFAKAPNGYFDLWNHIQRLSRFKIYKYLKGGLI